MSSFPSILSVISDPTATNKLNSPSHSSIESAQNDAVKKLETFIGTSASAVGTIMYDVRAVASDGGGHVQAANKGGTGQTALTKGDVLVASSSSVLSKLAVGSNNQVLTADSNEAAGVKWAGVANAADIQNETFIYALASVMSGSVYGVKLSENPSILSDGLGLVIKFPAAPTSSAMALQVFTSSSGSVAARIRKTDLTNPNTTDIVASMIGVLKFDSVSSVFQILNLTPRYPEPKIVYAGKDAADASATQTIAHGLGRTPVMVRFKTQSVSNRSGIGFYDGATQRSSHYDGASTIRESSVIGIIIGLTPPDNMVEGTVSFDATNVSISWVKTGTPSGVFQIEMMIW